MIGSKALLFEAVLLLMERCMNYMKQEWQENINLLELIQVCKKSVNCDIIKITQEADFLWQEEKENQ